MQDKLHIGIVASKFNRSITDSLVKGAEVFLRTGYMKEVEAIQEEENKGVVDEAGGPDKRIYSPLLLSYLEAKTAVRLLASMPPQITLLRVPGAYELPQGIQELIEAMQKKNRPLDAIVALGAIIRGHTPHFDYIAAAATDGIMKVGLKYNMPVGFGVITANSYKEAEQRASSKLLQSSEHARYPADKKGQNKKATKKDVIESNKGYEAALAVWQMILAAKRISDE